MCTGKSPKKVKKTAQELQGEREGQLLLGLAGVYDDVPNDVRRYATEDRTPEIHKLQGADYQQSMGGFGAQQYVTGGNRLSGLPSAASQTYAKGLAETRQNQGQNIFKGNLDAANYSLGAVAEAGQSNAELAREQTQRVIAEQTREQKAAEDNVNLAMGLGAIGYSEYKNRKAKTLAEKRHNELVGRSNGGGLGGYNVSGGSSTTPQYNDLSKPGFWSGY